jgi:hypothetical protein
MEANSLRMILDGLTPNPEEALSSNRAGGQGYDDIYKFLETKKLLCEQELYGKVTDLVTLRFFQGQKSVCLIINLTL